MFAYGQVGTNKKENCGFWSFRLSAPVIGKGITISVNWFLKSHVQWKVRCEFIQSNPFHFCRRFSICLIYPYLKIATMRELVTYSWISFMESKWTFDDVIVSHLLCYCSGNKTQ
jgi:hypothetical protein